MSRGPSAAGDEVNLPWGPSAAGDQVNLPVRLLLTESSPSCSSYVVLAHVYSYILPSDILVMATHICSKPTLSVWSGVSNFWGESSSHCNNCYTSTLSSDQKLMSVSKWTHKQTYAHCKNQNASPFRLFRLSPGLDSPSETTEASHDSRYKLQDWFSCQTMQANHCPWQIAQTSSKEKCSQLTVVLHVTHTHWLTASA